MFNFIKFVSFVLQRSTKKKQTTKPFNPDCTKWWSYGMKWSFTFDLVRTTSLTYIQVGRTCKNWGF